MRAMRRAPSTALRGVVVTAVLAAVAAVAGCGEESDEAGTSAAGTSASGGDLRAFDHEAGTTQIPEEPERVIVIYDGPRLDVALLCGVNVVGGGHSEVIPDGFADWHEQEAVEEIADIGWVGDIDIEAITALNPDLIVSQPEVDVNDTLADVAPTVLLDLTGNWWESAGDWKDAHRRLAELYNCEDRVEDEIAEVTERIADLRERIDEEELQVSVVRAGAESGLSVYSNRLYSAILGELGVDQPPAERVEGGIDFGDFSPERIPELDGDVILIRGLDESEGDVSNEEYYERTLSANPLWERLAAVEADQAHVVTGAEWNSTGGFDAADLILDDLEEVLPDADPDVYEP